MLDEPDWDIYYWSIEKRHPPERWANTELLARSVTSLPVHDDRYDMIRTAVDELQVKEARPERREGCPLHAGLEGTDGWPSFLVIDPWLTTLVARRDPLHVTL